MQSVASFLKLPFPFTTNKLSGNNVTCNKIFNVRLLLKSFGNRIDLVSFLRHGRSKKTSPPQPK